MTLIRPAKPPPPWLFRRLRTLDELEVGPARDTGGLDIRVLDGPSVRFLVITEALVSEERARSIADQYQRLPSSRLLLATARLSTRSRTVLREAGVSWVEQETGRCRLAGPGLLVELTIRSGSDAAPATGARRKTPPALLRDRSGLLAETLLGRPPGELLRLRVLAEDAGLSTALVSRLLDRLTRLGIVAAHGRPPKKQWTLHDPGALLDRWAEEERDAPEEVTGMSVWSRTPADLLQRIATALNEHGLRYAFGGVTAANLYVPTLTAAPMPELWVPADMSARNVARQLGGEVVASGANVRIWQRAGDTALRRATPLATASDGGSTAPVRVLLVTPYRAYVEARHAPGRGADVADALRRTFDLAPRVPTAEPHA